MCIFVNVLLISLELGKFLLACIHLHILLAWLRFVYIHGTKRKGKMLTFKTHCDALKWCFSNILYEIMQFSLLTKWFNRIIPLFAIQFRLWIHYIKYAICLKYIIHVFIDCKTTTKRANSCNWQISCSRMDWNLVKSGKITQKSSTWSFCYKHEAVPVHSFAFTQGAFEMETPFEI